MQLYIDGLSEETGEKDLTPLFRGVPSLASLRVIRDITSGTSRGFALAEVGDDAQGQAAIARLNGTVLAGRKLTVFKIHDTLPGEMELREWLRDNAGEVLLKVGVSTSQTVVDYGCGPGIFSLAAARIVGPAGKVYALDVRQRALDGVKAEASEQGLSNVQTVLLDRSKVSLTFADASVDVVLLYDVLQEIADKPGLLRELHRVLRPAGVLSVFPMHLGTDKLIKLLDSVGLFRVRDRYTAQGFESASVVVNLTKSPR